MRAVAAGVALTLRLALFAPLFKGQGPLGFWKRPAGRC